MIMNRVIVCLLLLVLFLIPEKSIVAQSKITAIEANLFYNANKSESEGQNVAGEFSVNIIGTNFTLWNTIIGEGDAKGYSNQTVVIVEITSNESSDKDQILKLKASSDNKILLQQEQAFSNINNAKYKLLFLINNTGCKPVDIKCELFSKGKLISSLTKSINFECGE